MQDQLPHEILLLKPRTGFACDVLKAGGPLSGARGTGGGTGTGTAIGTLTKGAGIGNAGEVGVVGAGLWSPGSLRLSIEVRLRSSPRPPSLLRSERGELTSETGSEWRELRILKQCVLAGRRKRKCTYLTS